MPTWAPWGTGTQVESGSWLSQSPTGVSGQYLGVSSEATYNFSGAATAVQVQIKELPASVAGVQAYLRVELDINNGLIIGIGDGNLFCQKQVGGAYTTPVSIAWPAGIIGLRIAFESGVAFWDTTTDGTTWTQQYTETAPFAITALKVILASGCYQAVASPGTVRWEGVNTAIALYEDLTGTASSKATTNAAIQPTDLYGKTIYQTSGLTAYWRLADSDISFLRDSSPGGNHHGFYTGTPGFGQAGPGALTNPSVDFTGANETAGWIDPDFGISGDFTLECWVKADTWVDFASIFNRRRYEVSEGGIDLEVRGTDGTVYFFLYSGGAWQAANVPPMSAGEWHHLVVAYDVAQTTFWMYVDGVFQIANVAAGVLNNPTTNVSIQIGRNVEYGHLFDGKIDEIALYNRPLAAQEVADHYTLGSAAPGLMPTSTSTGKATTTGVLTNPRWKNLTAAADGCSPVQGWVTRRSDYLTHPLVVRQAINYEVDVGAGLSVNLPVMAPIVPGSGILILTFSLVAPTVAFWRDGKASGISVVNNGTWNSSSGGKFAQVWYTTMNPASNHGGSGWSVRISAASAIGKLRVSVLEIQGIPGAGTNVWVNDVLGQNVSGGGSAGNSSQTINYTIARVNQQMSISRVYTTGTAANEAFVNLSSAGSPIALFRGNDGSTGYVTGAVDYVNNWTTARSTIEVNYDWLSVTSFSLLGFGIFGRAPSLVGSAGGKTICSGQPYGSVFKTIFTQANTSPSNGVATPVAIPAATARPSTLAAITDTFSVDGSPGGQWTQVGTLGVASIAGGLLNVGGPNLTANGYCAVQSGNIDLSGAGGKVVQLELVTRPTQVANNAAHLRIEDSAAPSTWYFHIGPRSTTLEYSFTTSGGGSVTSFIAWPTGLRAVRIWFLPLPALGANFYRVGFEYSIDGVRWVTIWQQAFTVARAMNLMRVAIRSEANNVSGPGTAQWDNLDVVPFPWVIYKDLTGSTIGRATNVGVISKLGKIDVAGSTAGIAVAVGQLTRRKSLVVASTGVAVASALIGRKRQLVVSSAGVASVTQVLTRKRALVGSSAGVAVEIGQPTRIRYLLAASAGVASASGTVIKTVYRNLTATSVGTSTAVGTVSSRPPTLLLFQDDFQRANSSTIGGLWVEDQGDWEIFNNDLRAFTYGTALAYNTTPLGTGDYRVMAVITAGTLWDAGGRGLGIVARYQDANNYYLAWVDSTPPVIKLYKVEGGTYTVIGQYSGDNPTDPVTVSLVCDGTTIKVIGEGNTERISVEDSTFSSGYFGVRTFNAPDFTHRFNDVSVYSLELPGAITGGTVGSSTTSATLRAKRVLTGASVASAVATAQITRRKSLTVSAAGVATSAGTVRRKVSLTAASAGVATEIGQPTAIRRLVAASTGIASTTGQLTRIRPIVASAAGVSVATGIISKSTAFKAITGSAVGVSTTAATVTRRRSLIVASVGGSTATGQPARKRHFVATSTGVATTTATILRRRAIVATATGVATASGSLAARRVLVAASAGTSIANGVIQKLGAQIFPAQRATGTAQKLVAEIKAGAVFGAAQMSATGQMHVSTAILGTTFPAGLLNATASKPAASILSGFRFQGELATASAQKLVAQYKTGTVFQGILSTATAQSLVGTIVLGTRFNAVLATASGTSYPLTVQLGTGFQAQLMQSTASAHALTLRAGAVWPAAATSVSVQSLTAVMRTSNGFQCQLASGTASLQLATFRFGVRISAEVMSASLQTFPLAIAASGLFLAQRMQATADIKAATLISSNVWQAQVMLANAESYFVTYRLGTSFLAALAVVNGQLRIAAIKESFGITSPGPDIIWAEHVVPVIVSADQLVPYIVGSGEPVPVIVNGELLLPYLYNKDELVPIIVSSDEV